MGFLKNLFGKGASTLVNSVGNVLDNIITTKEEKLKLENELHKAEMQYKLEVRKLNVEEKKLFLEDKAGAREREVRIQTSPGSTKLGKNISSYLALLTTLLTFFLFYILVFERDKIPADSKDIILYILGVLSAIITQIFSYYFGSSLGSAAKNDILRDEQAITGAGQTQNNRAR